MRRKNTMSSLIFLLPLVMTVHFNVTAQEDEDAVDRDNSVWSDVIPEQEPEVAGVGQESDSATSDDEEEQGGFTPTEKINVDSAISFPVDI